MTEKRKTAVGRREFLRVAGLGPAHARKRQRADGGERACADAGAAQEGAAVEAAVLGGERGGKAARRLLFPDQHGRPPLSADSG